MFDSRVYRRLQESALSAVVSHDRDAVRVRCPGALSAIMLEQLHPIGDQPGTPVREEVQVAIEPESAGRVGRGLDERAPLAGVKVVAVTGHIAGPFASMVLADLGADVTAVEPPGGDEVRGSPPLFGDDLSAPFAAFNRNKDGVRLDLGRDGGRDRLREMVIRADVFVENLRPGKLQSVGLGSDALMGPNPRLVYCSITPYGHKGPRSADPGFDAVIQAYSGLMDLTGESDGPPVRVGASVLDVGAGMWAVIGILCALRERDRTGRGGVVQAALLTAAATYMMHHLASVELCGEVPRRAGSKQHNRAPYEAIRTRDSHVMVAAGSQRLWRAFTDALGVSDLYDDPRFRSNAERVRNRDALVAEVEKTTRQMHSIEVEDVLREAGVPVSRVRTVGDFLADPQLEAMGLLSEVPGLGGKRLPVAPVYLDEWSPTIRRPPPAGQSSAQ